MNEPRDPLAPGDYIVLLALAIYGLAVASGVVWMLIQAGRLVIATGYAEQICGAGLVALAAVLIVATVRR